MAASSIETLSRAVGELTGRTDTGAPVADLDQWQPRHWRSALLDMPLDERAYQDRLQVRRIEEIESLWEWWSDRASRASPLSEKSEGYVGFFLLTLVAMHCSDRMRYQGEAYGSISLAGIESAELCRLVTAEPAVRSAISVLYDPKFRQPEADRLQLKRPGPKASRAVRAEWNDIDFDTLEFYRHGTTSLILTGSTSTPSKGRTSSFALKCLIYPYLRIPAIANATRDYIEEYGLIRSTSSPLVRVWASHDSWILMDFVAGETLADHLGKLDDERPKARNEARRPIDAKQIERLGTALFQALVELEREGLHHDDLTPSNIIVQVDDHDRVRFRLIDLGVNYLHNRAVSGFEHGEADYVAPEVKDDGDGGDLADLYSLGVLLIAIAGVQPTGDGTVPDRFYGTSVGLARLLEDLVDKDPDRRLMVSGIDPSTNRYKQISELFRREVEVVLAASDERYRSWYRRIRLLVPGAAAVERQTRIARVRRRQVRETGDNVHQRQARYLMKWAVASALLWWATMALLGTWLARDLGVDWQARWFELLNEVFNRQGEGLVFFDDIRADDYPIPDFTGNLPVRIAAITFVLPSYRFYLYILADMTPFSSLPRKGMLRLRTIAAGATMRAAAIIPAVFILIPTLVQRDWWMLFTPLGVIAASVFISGPLWFAKDAIGRARRAGLSTVPEGDIPTLSRFAAWEPMAWMYCIPVVVIGPLLYIGLLQDEIIYVGAVGLINVGIWFLKDTVSDAPLVRVGMSRAILAAERLDHLSAQIPKQADPRVRVDVADRQVARDSGRVAGPVGGPGSEIPAERGVQ